MEVPELILAAGVTLRAGCCCWWVRAVPTELLNVC